MLDIRIDQFRRAPGSPGLRRCLRIKKVMQIDPDTAVEIEVGSLALRGAWRSARIRCSEERAECEQRDPLEKGHGRYSALDRGRQIGLLMKRPVHRATCIRSI